MLLYGTPSKLLYEPFKQPYCTTVVMSALGQKRTYQKIARAFRR